MSRSGDPTSFMADGNGGGRADPRTATLPAPDAERHVCPFCGTVNETMDGPCPRCTMANTAETRKATKSRIGPWYVLQSRNPAAPGMRYETLLGFVRKGRVKSKSIVRGPTTHQLWRFASQVKGLSREFGVCYSCGGSIERDAQICPQCNRLQDPPPNPDIFLEGLPTAGDAPPPAASTSSLPEASLEALRAPVFKELNVPAPPPAAEAATPQPADAPRPVPATEPPLTQPSAEREAPRPTSSTAPLTPPPAPSSSPPANAGPRRRPNDVFLSARDLAAAFQLDFDPTDEGDAAFDEGPSWSASTQPAGPARARYHRPRRRRVRRALFVLTLLVVAGTVAVLALSPVLRARVVAWAEARYAALTGAALYKDLSRPDARPTGPARPAATAPSSSPAATSQPLGEIDELTGNPILPRDTGPASRGSVADRPSDGEEVDAPRPAAPEPGPPVARAAGSSEHPVRPMATQSSATAAPAAPPPAPTSRPASRPVDAQPKPPPARLSPEEALRKSKTLYKDALDAEDRGDYRRAKELYEQIINTLPRAVWYQDVESRLRVVKQELGEK